MNEAERQLLRRWALRDRRYIRAGYAFRPTDVAAIRMWRELEAEKQAPTLVTRARDWALPVWQWPTWAQR